MRDGMIIYFSCLMIFIPESKVEDILSFCLLEWNQLGNDAARAFADEFEGVHALCRFQCISIGFHGVDFRAKLRVICDIKNQ